MNIHHARLFPSDLAFSFGKFFFPLHVGYFTQLKNFPHFPFRSTNQPSAHSGQTENFAPQLHITVPGSALLATGRSFPHSLHGPSISPQR